ncbi:hypothetical protein [Streptomyces goshikiensis]|uniref:hypothetical protein n=1 Tax=Streptomyces goshikiensis TaxID=1942 RepID=UPI00371C9244
MPEQSARTDLVDLIKAHRQRTGLSLRDMEQRTIDPETGAPALVKTWFQKIEVGTLAKHPTRRQLHWLAVALDLPYRTVANAAAAQYYDVENVESDDGQVRSLVQRVERMTTEERDRLRQLMDIAFPSSADGA